MKVLQGLGQGEKDPLKGKRETGKLPLLEPPGLQEKVFMGRAVPKKDLGSLAQRGALCLLAPARLQI